MLRFLDRDANASLWPNASLWLIAAAQGAAMLGFNVLLRVLVS